MPSSFVEVPRMTTSPVLLTLLEYYLIFKCYILIIHLNGQTPKHLRSQKSPGCAQKDRYTRSQRYKRKQKHQSLALRGIFVPALLPQRNVSSEKQG